MKVCVLVALAVRFDRCRERVRVFGRHLGVDTSPLPCAMRHRSKKVTHFLTSRTTKYRSLVFVFSKYPL